jgi:hypothetical protein
MFDWTDTDPGNGVPDYYNMISGQGDELTRIQYAGGTGNVLKMDVSNASAGGLANVFHATPIVSVHDDNIWGWPYTGGNDLTVTVVTWKLQTSAGISIAEYENKADVILHVPSDDTYGIHQGFVIASNSTTGEVYKLPYTYNVYAALDTLADPMGLADGITGDWTPYEPGLLASGIDSNYAPQSSDHHSIVVDMVNSEVMYLAARVNWTYDDTDMDVAIVDMTGIELAHSGDSVKATEDSAIAMADVEGNTGMYIIHTTMNAIAGTAIPENYTLTVIGYNELDDPVMTYRWYSHSNTTKDVFTSGDSLVGDHVIVNATWTDGVMPGIPEWKITTTEIKVLYGTLFYEEGPLVHASDAAGQFSGIIDPTQFAWVTVPDLHAGDTARIVCDFDTSDADIMAWPVSIPMDQRSASNSITDEMTSGNKPEHQNVVLPESGDYDFGIMDYAGDGGNFYLTVDTRLGLEPARVPTNTIELDTYYLLANQTYEILIDSNTGTNLKYKVSTPDVFIGNYFLPHVTYLNATPLVADERTFNITWASTDLNAGDTPYYSLWYSVNDGVSCSSLLRT